MSDAKASSSNGDGVAIECRDASGRVEIVILKIVGGSGPDGSRVQVWSHSFGRAAAARVVFDVMVSMPARWETWARTAELLGTDIVDGLIEAEVLQAAGAPVPAVASQGSRSGSSDPIEGREAGPGSIRVWIDLGEGGPAIVAAHAGRPFMNLRLSTATEARRVWDWVRWQTSTYAGWYRIARKQGAPALIRIVLFCMLAVEQRESEIEPPKDPQRPLRHWRPEDAGDKDPGDGPLEGT